VNSNLEEKDKLAESALRSLNREFVVVGKTRVHSWTAWLLIGLAAGALGMILFIANRSGEFEPSSADAPNLIASFSLEEGSGSHAKDSSGNNRQLNLINGTTWADGKFGKAISFDGINDYATVPGLTSASLENGHTFSVWFYPTKQTSYAMLAGWWGYHTGLYQSGENVRYTITFQKPDNTLTVSASPYVPVTLNEWHHAAGIYDKAGKTMYLYLDGKLVGKSQTPDLPMAKYNRAMEVGYSYMFGTDYNKPEWKYKGLIDEVKVYDRALSAEEVKSLFTPVSEQPNGTVNISLEPTPPAQNVIAGTNQFEFARYKLDAISSPADARLANISLAYKVPAGNPNDLTNCRLYDGTIIVNSANIVNPVSASETVNFVFDGAGLTVQKGTSKTISLKCDVRSGSSGKYQWGFGGSAGQIMTAIPGGALVASLDSASASLRIVNSGATNVELSRIRFSASGEDIDLRQVALQLSGTEFNTPDDLVGRSVSLWTTEGVQIGTAIFSTQGDYATSSQIASGAFRIPKDASRTLVVKGNISNICSSCDITTPGDVLKVDYDGNNNGVGGNYGIGISSGFNITPTSGDTVSEGVRIFKAYPSFASIIGWQPSTIANGNRAVYRFSVKANGGDVGIHKFTVKITATNLSGINIFGYTDSAYSSPVTGVNAAGQLSQTNASLLSNETRIIEFRVDQNGIPKTLVIPSGSTYYFEVRGTMTGVTGSSGYVSTQLEGDASLAQVGTAASIEGTSDNDFIWSPNSLGISALTFADFANGNLLPGLPSSNMSPQVLSNGVPPSTQPAPTPTPAPASLLMHYKFDEGTGKQAKDNISAINGTLSGSAAFISGGVSGGAVRFGGIAAPGTLDFSSTKLPLENGFSIETWARPTAAGNYSMIFESRYLAPAVWIRPDQTIGFDVYDYTKHQWNKAGTEKITLNQWHHIVGTYDKKELKLYVNGKFVASVPYSTLAQRGNAYRIGNDYAYDGYAKNYSFEGDIDEFKIYNDALSAEEVKKGYDGYASVPVVTQTPPVPVATTHASTKFIAGDRVQVNADVLNVRSTPNGTILSPAQTRGIQGRVIAGPQNLGGYNWWQIDFDSGSDGWSAEDFLVKAAVVATPTPVQTQTQSMAVVSSTPVKQVDSPAALPQSYVDTTYSAPTGKTISVPQGGDLQAALNNALPGDVISLQAGVTYSGNFTLPKKSGVGWVTLRTSVADTSLPQGTRVTPANAALMPKIVSPNTMSAITAAKGAHHYRFIGVEIATTHADTSSTNYNVVLLGDGTETNLADLPSDIIFDRTYIHGTPTGNIRRGIALNGTRLAVIDSYLSDFHEIGADSQAILGWNGPGPYKIVNNYLEAAGENMMFGGADPKISNLVPSDIEVRRNNFAKQLKWKIGEPSYAGIAWSVKNIFELKNARRVLVDGNIFEYNWPHSQNGFSILFTVRNQDGTAPWSVVEDVTFTNNILRHAAAGINILGTDNLQPSQQTKRIFIKNNLFEDIGGKWGFGRLFQVLSGAAQVVIDHNTALNSETMLFADGVASPGFIYRNNIASHNSYGVIGTGTGIGSGTLNTYFPGYVFNKNVLVGGISTSYPQDNYFPLSTANIGFVNMIGGDYHLSPSSPYKNIGTDGKDLGANIDLINSAIAK